MKEEIQPEADDDDDERIFFYYITQLMNFLQLINKQINKIQKSLLNN